MSRDTEGAADVKCCVAECKSLPGDGIERCRYHERRRLALIAYKARKKANPSPPIVALPSDRCAKRIGRGVCGSPLTAAVDRGSGLVVVSCPACERQAAGLCADCPERTHDKRGRRCQRCAKKRQQEQQRHWYSDHRTEALRAAKKRHRVRKKDPVWRERAAEYRREYQSGEWWRTYQRNWKRAAAALKRGAAA